MEALEFKNKVVLITGAGSGIGLTTALAFAEEGARVVVSDINEKSGLAAVSKINAAGGEAIFIKCDVANYDEVKNMIETAVLTYDKIDVAMNNAGIGGEYQRTAEANHIMFDKVMQINCNGVFYCMQEEIKVMQQQGSGVIINTASIAGLRALPNSLAYVASKHAVVGMTKTAAKEYATKNIRVNALCPVFTVTPLFDPEVMDQLKAGISDRLKQGIPMKRFSTTHEMADATMWLASDRASFVTGLALPIDGGLTA